MPFTNIIIATGVGIIILGIPFCVIMIFHHQSKLEDSLMEHIRNLPRN
jgi:hypothetical protein